MRHYEFYEQEPIQTAKFLERKLIWYAWRGEYDLDTYMCSGDTELEAVTNLLETEE